MNTLNRVVLLIAIFLLANINAERITAQTRCYTTNYNKAEQLYRQGRYAEAKRYYKAASACPDKPKRNNIAARISDCDNAIREATDQRRRQQEAERNGYIRITNIKFGNTDDDGNLLSDYGSTLYASDIRYLKPRIYYDGLCNTQQTVTFFYKIYKPNGELESSASSPAGYTSSFQRTVYPGKNQMMIASGWGNNNSGSYAPGTYRYELWHDGNFVYSTNFSLLSNRYAKIESIWVDHNQMRDGVKGMLIHVKFSVYNMLNRTGRCIAYFYYDDADNTPLQDLNNSYRTSSGHVAVGKDFSPSYESSTYNDFTLFIPYSELHVTGKHSLKFHIRIYDKESDEWLCDNSAWQYFTYGY